MDDEIAKLIEQAIIQERKAIWEEINNHVKTGELQGNGCDDTAQRNGMILACNIVMDRIIGN